MTIEASIQSGPVFFDTSRAARTAHPDARFTAGVSNTFYGLPARSFINRAFLAFLALAAGLNSTILDRLGHELRAALLPAELVLGRDDHCLKFTRAYRAELFDCLGAKPAAY